MDGEGRAAHLSGSHARRPSEHIAAIKREYAERQDKANQKQKSLTDADVRRILQDELRNQGRFSTPSQYISNWRI